MHAELSFFCLNDLTSETNGAVLLIVMVYRFVLSRSRIVLDCFISLVTARIRNDVFLYITDLAIRTPINPDEIYLCTLASLRR